MKIAVVADLHNSEWSGIIRAIEEEKPDIIVSPGDLLGSLADRQAPRGDLSERYIAEANENKIGFAFLEAAGKIAPIYCSIGNHEVYVSPRNLNKITRTGAVLLDNSYTTLDNGVILGGLTSGGARGLFRRSGTPNTEWIEEFGRLKGPKILLSHHPEYWKKYIVGKGIDLTVSGHAHGGQWRIFGRGILAPGQGLFPRYTGGVYELGSSKLMVSRGLRCGYSVPRINNPPEVVIIEIEG